MAVGMRLAGRRAHRLRRWQAQYFTQANATKTISDALAGSGIGVNDADSTMTRLDTCEVSFTVRRLMACIRLVAITLGNLAWFFGSLRRHVSKPFVRRT